MVGMVPGVIKNDLCEFVVFKGFKSHIVNTDQYLLFCVSDAKKKTTLADPECGICIGNKVGLIC